MNQIRSICSNTYQRAVRIEQQICLEYGALVAVGMIVIPLFLSMGSEIADSFERPDYHPSLAEHAWMAIKPTFTFIFFGCASLKYLERSHRLKQQTLSPARAA